MARSLADSPALQNNGQSIMQPALVRQPTITPMAHPGSFLLAQINAALRRSLHGFTDSLAAKTESDRH
jgi:hypothetical protein